MTRYSPPAVLATGFQGSKGQHKRRVGYDPVESDFIQASHSEREYFVDWRGMYDLFAERQPIEELWQKWGQPEIWRLLAWPTLVGCLRRA